MSGEPCWEEIIGRVADGAATGAEIAELNTALKGDARLRAWYVQYMHLDAALAQAALIHSAKPAHDSSGLRQAFLVAGAIAVAVAICFLPAFFWSDATSATSREMLATLVAAQDAVWSDPNTELALHGGQLPAGVLRLDEGTAEFLLSDGATIALHAPASLEIQSRKRIFMQQGRIFCRCATPESRIVVATPNTEIVDLGTEFSVEARNDSDTRVAVFQGEVRIGHESGRVLRTGEAVRVRGDGILAVEALAPNEFADLLLTSPVVSEAVKPENNLLQDAGFEQGLTPQTWNGTSANLEIASGAGRSGNAVRIRSDGVAHWPQCRQQIRSGDISGKLVVASVWAAPDRVSLDHRQQAMLKISFVNEAGHEFAFALHRFLSAQSPANRFEAAQVAAIAPAGTKSIQLQLMFQTHLREKGAVLFDDASLMIVDNPIASPPDSPAQE